MFQLNREKTLLIAEIGGNHEGSLSRAKDLMVSAFECGADVIKFQSYSPEGLVNQYLRPDRYKHFLNFCLSDDEWLELAEYAQSNKIHFSSSIWESRFLDLLDQYICFYKVGSGDLSNTLLIKEFLMTDKPIVISTAMAESHEIKRTLDFITSLKPEIIKDNKLGMLQCTAMYDEPKSEEVHLNVMKSFKEEYGCLVGYSNHGIGINPILASIALEADIVEFHFTDNKTGAFRDHKISIDAHDLLLINQFNQEFKSLLGSGQKKVLESEKSNKTEFRRGLYLNKDMKQDSIVSKNDLISLRPMEGIESWDIDQVLNKKLKKTIKAFSRLTLDDFE